MSMHRRPVGRARILASVGAIVALVGCFLPWWMVGGGQDQLTARGGNAFDSTGIVVFAAAIATLALVTLPYASERPVSADRWQSYAVIAGLGWIGFLYRLLDLGLAGEFFTFRQPTEVLTHIPGLWVAGIGLAILARAIFDMAREPRLR
jgi:hypothetical protein